MSRPAPPPDLRGARPAVPPGARGGRGADRQRRDPGPRPRRAGHRCAGSGASMHCMLWQGVCPPCRRSWWHVDKVCSPAQAPLPTCACNMCPPAADRRRRGQPGAPAAGRHCIGRHLLLRCRHPAAGRRLCDRLEGGQQGRLSRAAAASSMPLPCLRQLALRVLALHQQACLAAEPDMLPHHPCTGAHWHRHCVHHAWPGRIW